MWPHLFASPAWVAPTALGIAALSLAAAANVLRLGRAAATALVLGATLAGVSVLHDHRVLDPDHPCQANPSRHCLYLVRPGWVDPTALGIALLGLAATAGVLLTVRRRAT